LTLSIYFIVASIIQKRKQQTFCKLFFIIILRINSVHTHETNVYLLNKKIEKESLLSLKDIIFKNQSID